MLSHAAGEALIVGFQGPVVLGIILVLHAFWRDQAFTSSTKEGL